MENAISHSKVNVLVATLVYLACFATIFKLNVNKIYTQTSKSIKPAFEFAVIVPTSRGSFEKRETVRKTWGRSVKNMLFLIGDEYCKIPRFYRINPYECEIDNEKVKRRNGTVKPRDLEKYMKFQESVSENLKFELNQTDNRIELLPMVDTYRNLTLKLLLGYKQALENFPLANWILKVDDDMFLKPELMELFLEHFEVSHSPQDKYMLGHIDERLSVTHNSHHKNGETKFESEYYPKTPLGSYGHIVSRGFAELLVRKMNILIKYQGEDVSLGIWAEGFSSCSVDVKVVDISGVLKRSGRVGSRVDFEKDCADDLNIVIGHPLNVSEIETCWKISGIN